MNKELQSCVASRPGMAALALLGLVCTACPNPNLYGTPRTNAPGTVTHALAAEAYGYRGKYANGTVNSGTVPTAPTYGLRIGVVDRFDIGLRIANMSSLGADFKLNFLRTDSFDMAVVPGGQWFNISVGAGDAKSSLNVVYLHAPLMLGINFSPDATLILTPGVSYAYVSSTASASGSSAAATSDGVMGRFGVGFQYRFTDSFALTPEITAMQHFGDNDYLLYLVGFGFNFGRLPSHGPAAAAPAAAPAPGSAQ